MGPDKPIVLVAVNWLEIRTDAYDRWCEAIGQAVETSPERVLVHSVHQHDAPLADLTAQKILDRHGVSEGIVDLAFHEQAVQRVAVAAKESLAKAQPITHYGVGQARVERVAANRRYLAADGTPRHDRISALEPGYAKDQPEGVIDPWLKTLSFWNGETPVAAISAYSCHPQSIYRLGRVSADFPGLAPARWAGRPARGPADLCQRGERRVIAGKYNDSSRQDREGLLGRLHQAMVAAWNATERHPLKQLRFRTAPVKLTERNTWLTAEDLAAVRTPKSPTDSSLAARLAEHAPAFQIRP